MHAWIIERHHVDTNLIEYWDGTGPHNFSSQYTDAIRFAGQEDAEKVMQWVLTKRPLYRIEYHAIFLPNEKEK
ncbi:MAG: hypothetical protein ABIT70_05680 [Sulfuriferula sp.]